MLLWLAILILTALTVLVLARPLLRPAATGAVDAAPTGTRRAVYADQLAEVEAEVQRGTLAESEAEAARIELSRRLLAEAALPIDAGTEREIARPARIVIVAAVPLAALAVYAVLGNPALPGRPFASEAARRAADSGMPAEIAEMVAKVEARLRETPQDGRGWDAIAPVYLRMRRFDDARAAFARAIELQGETVKRLAGLAEAAIRANDGVVPDEARAAYEKVVRQETGRLDARFWLALAREQHGEIAAAADEYRAILDAAPADAPWRAAVAERLAASAGAAVPPLVQAPAIPGKGPGAADVKAAEAMSPEQRQQMISSMIEGLHSRLKSDGRDVAGWQKLLRAYGVLGDRDKAVAALAEARRALAADKDGLAALDALAREMRLGT